MKPIATLASALAMTVFCSFAAAAEMTNNPEVQVAGVPGEGEFGILEITFDEASLVVIGSEELGPGQIEVEPDLAGWGMCLARAGKHQKRAWGIVSA